MTPQELLQILNKGAEAKGFAMHADTQHCLEIAESLLLNRERYGYMSCPCRLSVEDAKQDADIICPCKYHEKDIEEQGACFCVFFVANKHKDDLDFFPEVDDRREI